MHEPWQACELTFVADESYPNPYVDVDVWVDFRAGSGPALRRPAFFDGDATWRVRFAAPRPGRWEWVSDASVDDAGLRGVVGEFDVAPTTSGGRFRRHGFWQMSPEGRSLVHADGRPAVLVADTAWALPFRATEAEVLVYAADRAAKGFNAALLMTVQPDMRAVGPQDRTADEGFGVAFSDLPDGRLQHVDVDYFRTLDRLLDILLEHEIVPVLQQVFFGFGWKGLGSAGPEIPPDEYARYCRYLVARYGGAPAIYLVSADGTGNDPQVDAGGREIETWDCYHQPTGIHYGSVGRNQAHQDAAWLDFQWCQTGHSGEHVPERVADMWRSEPSKAVANGEPTYERTAADDIAVGWWQGHEAWSNLCAGGTMGVVYGAANLWQWKHHPGEPGFHPAFAAPDGDWRTALDYDGSVRVGLVSHLLDGLPTTDMVPDWTSFAGAPRGLKVSGRLQITYLARCGILVPVDADDVPLRYRTIDPTTGAVLGDDTREPGQLWHVIGEGPRLLVFYDGGTD